jgi:hypothetical protein
MSRVKIAGDIVRISYRTEWEEELKILTMT